LLDVRIGMAGVNHAVGNVKEMAMSEQTVLYELRDGVAYITLNRPEVSNAVDLGCAHLFGDVVSRVAAEGPRAVLIDGRGKRFCAGGDVSSIVYALDHATYVHELADTFEAGLRRLSELPVPIVAAVHGAVAGAGLAVVMNCDVVIAARSTKFLMAYSAVGLTPDCGVSYLLPRAVGQQRALELALTGRTLSADEALAWGLVAQVVEDEDVLRRAAEVATQVAHAATSALGQAKRLIRSSWESTRSDSALDESATIARAVGTDEATSLVARFAKRS
jgi:2-(1,2-epoxy-1,2-dihydrophenyl)acetyl-CoA isomerase